MPAFLVLSRRTAVCWHNVSFFCRLSLLKTTKARSPAGIHHENGVVASGVARNAMVVSEVFHSSGPLHTGHLEAKRNLDFVV